MSNLSDSGNVKLLSKTAVNRLAKLNLKKKSISLVLPTGGHWCCAWMIMSAWAFLSRGQQRTSIVTQRSVHLSPVVSSENELTKSVQRKTKSLSLVFVSLPLCCC